MGSFFSDFRTLYLGDGSFLDAMRSVLSVAKRDGISAYLGKSVIAYVEYLAKAIRFNLREENWVSK